MVSSVKKNCLKFKLNIAFLVLVRYNLAQAYHLLKSAMKPYPIEFRQKIIEVHKKEGISIRKLAQRFCVAPSNIAKIAQAI